MQRTHAGGIAVPARWRGDQCAGGGRVAVGRFVQDQRDRFQRCQRGGRIDLHGLVAHHELRLLDDHAIDAHPAAFDVLLRLAPRALRERDDAFVQPLRFGHVGAIGECTQCSGDAASLLTLAITVADPR